MLTNFPPGSCGEAALKYAALGWRVLPTVPMGKEPIGRLVPNGIKGASKDAIDIRRWWSEVKNANVAIAATSGLLIIDADVKNGNDGVEAFRAWCERNGVDITNAACVETPSGGRHYYWLTPNGYRLRPRTNVLPGVDVRVGSSYAVAPPSSTDIGVYRWVKGEGEIPPIATEPLVALTRSKTIPTDIDGPLDSRIPKGRRNEALASIAGALRRQGAGVEIIEQAILALNPILFNPPVIGAELKKYLRDARGIAVRYDPNPPTLSEADTSSSYNPTVWTPDTLSSAAFPEPTWLIPNLVPEGGLFLLAGRPKVGKSWLGLLWASLIARSVYMPFEDNERRLKARLEQLGIEGNNPRIWLPPPPRCPEGLATLRGIIKDYKPRCLIIDPWAPFAPRVNGNRRLFETDYTAIRDVKNLADDEGTTIILVHHTRKPFSGGTRDDVDEVLGSTGLTACADAIAVLKRGRNSNEATLSITGRDVESRQITLTFAAGRWEMECDITTAALSKERRDIQNVLRNARGPLSPKEIAEALEKTPASVKVLLAKMFQAGEVVRTDRGSYTAVT